MRGSRSAGTPVLPGPALARAAPQPRDRQQPVARRAALGASSTPNARPTSRRPASACCARRSDQAQRDPRKLVARLLAAGAPLCRSGAADRLVSSACPRPRDPRRSSRPTCSPATSRSSPEGARTSGGRRRPSSSPAGRDVVIAGRRSEVLEQTSAELGPRCTWVSGDIRGRRRLRADRRRRARAPRAASTRCSTMPAASTSPPPRRSREKGWAAVHAPQRRRHDGR